MAMTSRKCRGFLQWMDQFVFGDGSMSERITQYIRKSNMRCYNDSRDIKSWSRFSRNGRSDTGVLRLICRRCLVISLWTWRAVTRRQLSVLLLILWIIYLKSSLTLAMYVAAVGETNGNIIAAAQKLHPSPCPAPCACKTVDPVECLAGVTVSMDGCSCCRICSRQYGDICDNQYICDDAKDLVCSPLNEHAVGATAKHICRARNPASCYVDGIVYKDGEQFSLNCRMSCLCQDGHYSCTSLCPWEDRPPSHVHCREPMLVDVDSQCCKEWVCPWHYSVQDYRKVTKSPYADGCIRETLDWSHCSESCGMGVSIKQSNDNPECRSVQEIRLCMVRPCWPDGSDPKHAKHANSCKTTWRAKRPSALRIGGCESVEEYRPKYCSSCKTHRCCEPSQTETRTIRLRCSDNKTTEEKYMWIKSCECKKCH